MPCAALRDITASPGINIRQSTLLAALSRTPKRRRNVQAADSDLASSDTENSISNTENSSYDNVLLSKTKQQKVAKGISRWTSTEPPAFTEMPKPRPAICTKRAFLRNRQKIPYASLHPVRTSSVLLSMVSDTDDTLVNHIAELNSDQDPEHNSSQRVTPLASKYTNRCSSGQVFGIADEAGYLRLCESLPRGQRTLARWQAHNNAIFDISFTADDQKVIAVSADETCSLWDTTTQALVGSFMASTKTMRSVCAHPSNPHIFVSGSRDAKIMVWDTRCNGAATQAGFLAHRPVDVIINAHGPSTARSRQNRKYRSARSLGKPLSQTTSITGTQMLTHNPHLLASTCSYDGEVRLWDIRRYGSHLGNAFPTPVATSKVLDKANRNSQMQRSRGITSLHLDPTGTRLYTTCSDNSIRIYNAISLGEPLGEYTAPQLECKGFFVRSAVSPDGRYLAAGSSSSVVNIWELDSFGLPLRKDRSDIVLEGHMREVSCVSWKPQVSATDPQLLTCSDDGTVRIWRSRPDIVQEAKLDPRLRNEWGFASYASQKK
ncbi:hypothetical protein H4219_002791 [Mycoemilia scoparia]|uniref:Uncharacterized protein n=1 Tax=Mycoemilia scoparia TaxID=417184 RepID=A0A9W8A2D2_9FUNG|nr:hypothetical protein H4219_002791 [Mycoemilia scoparia]